MAGQSEPLEIDLPELPVKHDRFIEFLDTHKTKPMLELVQPYQQYDSEMRKLFAQHPDHPAIATPSVVPIFVGLEKSLNIRARDPSKEDQKQQDSYIMPLKQEERRANGSPAIVQSLRDFRTNFNVFSESSLVDLKWDNVVVAGSAVVTPLLAVPEKHSGSKRALREYYHEQLAPASDVDLFLYDLTEDQAMEKIREIEQSIRDAILTETTTVRTKNAITIVSQYPTRHVQIVLRIYKSVSEILTGFDVDCSCAAYDGKQVYASPRAIAAFVTQINSVDLARRSPSYENRLSKYAKRGFEIFWPNLDRSRIDPTIFERSFGRTEGLARLLILEKLPKSQDRDNYLDQRRAERGRPAINRYNQRRHQIWGNIKDDHEDEVAEWVDSNEVSNYHSFTISYGPKFHARKIEKLLFTKDLLLNSEWNKPKDRAEINLHRHPAFFGRAEDVFGDCCGYCPVPGTEEEEELAEEESKIYVSGDIRGRFLIDNPGRQMIGSFNPIDADGWTDMAYVGNTEQLCRAIVDGDKDFVESWLEQEGNDPNTRDWTGRTPLHLAVVNSTLEVVELLISHGSRVVARLADGKTALHLAAIRGSVEIVSALLRKSEANEEAEEAKLDAKRKARAAGRLDVAMADASLSEKATAGDEHDSDIDMVDDDEDDNMDATTENSIVNIKSVTTGDQKDVLTEGSEENDDEPDVYDVNVVAWDAAVSPLHLAIVKGNVDVVRCLVTEFGADILLPIKIFNDYDKSARGAILTLVLALQLPLPEAETMSKTLIELGATIAQSDMHQNTTLQYCIAEQPDMLQTLLDADQTGAARAMNHLSISGSHWRPDIASPLMRAIVAKDSLTALLLLGNKARPEIDFAAYMKAIQTKHEASSDSAHNKQQFQKQVQQPVISAVQSGLPELAQTLVEKHEVDVNTLTPSGWSVVHDEYTRRYSKGESLLDKVRSKLDDLKEWKPDESEVPEKPLPMKDDADYLSDLAQGSYRLWSANKQVAEAKTQYERELKEWTKATSKPVDKTGIPEKQAAISDMVKRYEELEAVLLQRSAKTFQQLYPDFEKPEDRDNRYRHHRYTLDKPKPFEVAYTFRVSDLTDETHARYMRLFESSWSGDIPAVKQLTLTQWKNEDDVDQPPLRVATQDQHGLSPFHIAVLSGHLELASAIMEIAKAQYQPPDAPKKRRYGVNGGVDDEYDSDDDLDDDDSEVPLYSELVDEEFTVENVGEVSTQVKSRVKPLAMLRWNAPVEDFMGGPLRSSPQNGDGLSYFGPRRQHTMAGKRTNTGSLKAASNTISEEKRKIIGPPRNLIQFALHNDDHDLLAFILSLGQQYTRSEVEDDDDGAKRYFTIDDADFLEAIKLDQPHLVAEIIKQTGAGIPLDQLVRKSGVDIAEKPKYYQGLSVYGKKRKDWADRGREQIYQPTENNRPPFLEACHANSLETIEWFLSDAPLRSYQEFARANKDDKRVKALTNGKGGFEATLRKFLTARGNLAIHCCLMAKPTPETFAVLKFLTKTFPDSIDHRSREGITPLAICFRFYREECAKMLIKAGADQTVRTKVGENIVHNALRLAVTSKKAVARLRSMLELIDKRLLRNLFTERSSKHPGSLTPTAQWIQQVIEHNAYTKHGNEVLQLVLDWSEGEELNFVNGEGNTPLHVAVRQSNEIVAQTIIARDPTLALRENATGLTPYEIAEDRSIASICNSAPPLPDQYGFSDRKTRKHGWPQGWANDLASRDPKDFFQEVDKDRRTSQEKVWDLLKATKSKLEEQGLAKRRLVTLNEANEVAKRLAANKAGSRRAIILNDRGDQDTTMEEDIADEVQMWLPSTTVHFEEGEDGDEEN
ncbi:Putative ankyrin repeat-containing domain superfamily [Septoria linicola]|uniref:Ankyrin repeat-containing domain superfamily n=1 Tax=Septoria linicola TaxID=215465 RepID=A0A9Q9ATH6_9PEZI|nr:putative ankyrin repeat-containing domain superfamily [Septoria linicola]USW51853.1 Putative ankyrin repeat-containing domain superfamily [Septoria linicola]